MALGAQKEHTSRVVGEHGFAVHFLSEIPDATAPREHEALADRTRARYPSVVVEHASERDDALATADVGPLASMLDGARFDDEIARSDQLGHGEGAKARGLGALRQKETQESCGNSAKKRTSTEVHEAAVAQRAAAPRRSAFLSYKLASFMDSIQPSSLPFRADSPTLAHEIKDYMARHQEVVGKMIQSGGEEAGAKASERWARVFDGLLSALFCAVRSNFGDEKSWKTLSLAAVGSYGRGGFGFKSDLDVRLLCKSQKKAGQIAEAFLYPLWDAGIQVGHQVVTQSAMITLAKGDLATATTLLDWRHLAGDPSGSAELQEKAFSTLFSPANVQEFLSRLSQQTEERWNRFGASVYLLEPDVKSGQGGLRDLDVVHWTALSRWRVRSLKGLVNIGVLLPREYEQIEEASAFLWRIRNVLHFNTKRRTDRLSFEQQELVAERMGYGGGGAGCESLMSDYYRHARAISNVRELLLARAEPPPKKRQKAKSLGNGVQLLGESVALEDPDRLQAEPALALRLYWEAVHRDLPVFRLSRDAISRAANGDEFCERLRKSDEAAVLFRRLVRVVRKVRFKRDSLLTELHDVGLLLAMIPEFKPVVGRVHHDIYHVYTVDAHSIAAVDRLRALCRGELAAEHPIASRLAAEIARPQVLFMAALIHDIGKDIGGRKHSERGFDLSRTILERLGVAEHDIVEVQHLVLKHLRMYHVASRRDIDDPQTIESFREEVHGPEGLRELYVLTLCDVATTSPQALTSWKERMLEELYVRALAQFEGMPGRTEQRAESLREAARQLCPAQGERDFLEHFLTVVPERYLYANEPEDIVAHSRLARMSQTRRFMTAVLTHDGPYTEVGFITDDKPGALANITAVLAANRLRVAGAQLYSWLDEHGRKRVLDLFWVRSGDDPKQVELALPRVEQDFEKLLGGETTADVLIASRQGSKFSERPAPDVPTGISFDNRSAQGHTIIEVAAQDRPGLLYRLARTLSSAGLQVALAKINTEGNAVADVFYVVDADGKKVTDPVQVDHLHKQLKEAAQRNNIA